MGCGGSSTKVVEPQETETTKPQEVVDSTWATKTDVAKRPSSKEHAGLEHSGQGSNVKAFVLEDADDEIEIVDEGRAPRDQQPKTWTKGQRDLPSAANAQEAPQLVDNSNQMQFSTRPAALPSKQAEEAAKLAETRRKFDNQRYSQQYNQPATSGTSPAYVPPRMQSSSPSLSTSPNRTGVEPIMSHETAALPISLTKAATGPGVGHAHEQLGAFLPGGVLDDLELDDFEQEVVSKAQHEIDFNDEDEALMKEILEDFEDM